MTPKREKQEEAGAKMAGVVLEKENNV